MTSSRHAISNKRKLNWVSDDIEDEAVTLERSERKLQAQNLAWNHGVRRKELAAEREDYKKRSQQYSYLLRKGLTRPRATLAAYDMPYVKKGKKKPAGIGATYRAKKKAANYGATPSFNRALVAAVKKVEAKSQETVYSQSGAYLNSGNSTLTTSGYSMSGLNQSAAYSSSTPATRVALTNNCFVWPISPMAQVGNSSTPGYRKGQRINPVGFRFGVEHQLNLQSVPAVYRWAVVRNKSATLTVNNTTPGISATNSLQLFVPLTQGPLVTAGGPNGQLPMGDFSSCMRWNYQEWSVSKQGSWSVSPELARENTTLQGTPVSNAVSQNQWGGVKLIKGYVPFKDANWDYPTPTGISNIKGGDYYFIIWREGPPDAQIGIDFMTIVCELSFKDP